jgi:allantoinase
MGRLVVRGRRVLVSGQLGPAALHIEGERIADVTAFDVTGDPDCVVEAGDRLVTPGIVDSHVHVNEPGRTDWEGFCTATEAAAAGGITTVVDMPLNCIPATTSRDAAERKLECLEGRIAVDVAFWGGVVPGNAGELRGLADVGVPGAKCFLCPSGVDEFPHVGRADLEIAMPVLRDLGLVLLVHAEAPGPLDRAEALVRAEGADPRRYATYLRSRPNAAEDEAIAMIVELSRKHRCPAHVVHLSSASALPILAEAQADGVPVTAETCLHYLAFAAEDIADGGTEFKCAPPIRDRDNQEQLWQGLAAGTLSMVVSDHSPCRPELKQRETGDFLGAWGGISGLQLGLPVLFTLALERGYDVAQLAAWHAEGPARLSGLAGRKGRLATGYDADFVIWDDTEAFTVEPSSLLHRHKLTPYAGLPLRGAVHQTWIRGRLAFDRTTGPASRPVGSFLAVRR